MTTLDLSTLPARSGSTWADQLIVLRDDTAGGIEPIRLWQWKWCFDRQLKFHYGRSPWVERGYAPPAYCSLLPRGATVPKGAWPIFLKDVADIEGALGYHETGVFASKVGDSGIHSIRGKSSVDATSGDGPYSEVFVTTTEQDAVDPLEVISHEGNEMLGDPTVQPETAIRKVKGPNHDFYIVELGDPVQGRGYDVFAPEGKTAGFTLADIVYPRWFAMDQTRPACSLTEDDEIFPTPPNSGLQPFEVAPYGYQSVAPESNPSEWTTLRGAQAAPGANKQ